jgi:hypothetical protein
VQIGTPMTYMFDGNRCIALTITDRRAVRADSRLGAMGDQ